MTAPRARYLPKCLRTVRLFLWWHVRQDRAHGQGKADFSALCVLERTTEPGQKPQYAVRHLQRWPLGTQYPLIVRQVGALLDRAPLSRKSSPLVIDLTGVGRAVGDLFTAGGIRPRGITLFDHGLFAP